MLCRRASATNDDELVHWFPVFVLRILTSLILKLTVCYRRLSIDQSVILYCCKCNEKTTLKLLKLFLNYRENTTVQNESLRVPTIDS